MKRLDRLLTGDETLVTMIYSSRNLYLLGFLLFGLIALMPGKVFSSTLGEEFLTSGSFQKGSIVSIKQNDPEDIELTTIVNSEYLLGVITESGDNLVAYAKDNSDVTVSLTGEVRVFVTSANGAVIKGDFVGASWLEGVGMKAITSDKQKLLGIALEDFSEESGSEYGAIDTPDGSKDVRVGTILVRLFDKEGADLAALSQGGIEGFLTDLAGKNVSFIKIMAASIIFVMSVLISGFFVSSSIRGSFISIGRNPMASTSIYRSLLHVTMVSVVIILIGTALTYVVLVV